MKRAYYRCNSGHYFLGQGCPLDGWSSTESAKLETAIGRLLTAGRDPSLAELKKEGLTDADLKRVIVIEFGCDESAFEAFSPEGYVVDGRWMEVRDLGDAFK